MLSAASPLTPVPPLTKSSIWKVAGATWFGTVVIDAVGWVLQDTIDPVTWDEVGFCSLFGLFFGSVGFLTVSGPLQAIVLLFVNGGRLSRRAGNVMLALPLLIFAMLSAYGLAPRYLRSEQPGFYASVLHRPFPTEVKLLTWGHGFGLQDKRDFWMFEGTPEQFQAFKLQMALTEALPDEDFISKTAMDHAKAACPPDQPWTMGAFYFWWEDSASGPEFSNRGYVYVDKSLRRWLVWWSAI